jgi:uncharacterized protein
VIFTATAPGAFRHAEAITAGAEVLGDLVRGRGLDVEHTEDPTVFTPDSLTEAVAVVFHQVNGAVLGPSQRAALLDFVRDGGGFVGIHNTSAAEPDWPAFVDLVGGRFVGHPELTTEPIALRPDRTHPTTQSLSDPWLWSDEWYDFDRTPTGVDIVLRAQPIGKPLAWAGRYGAGHTFYTALGHRPEAYADADFVSHLAGALAWGMAPG